MAWTYYTAPLPAGAILTLDQRNELYSALVERINALPSPSGITYDAGPNAAILASRVISNKVSINGSFITLDSAVNLISNGYLDPAQNGTANWGNLAVVDPSMFSSVINLAAYWNGVRAGIISLTTVRLDLTDTAGSQSSATLGGPFATEALAAADLVAAAQTVTSTTTAFALIHGFNGPSSYKFSQSIFTSGTAAAAATGNVLYTLKGNSGNTVFPTITFTLGAAATVTIPAAGVYLGGSLAGSGAAWSVKLPDQTNATQLATDFGNPGTQNAGASIYMGGGAGTAVGLQPAFVYN